jgi:hypothetical protein
MTSIVGVSYKFSKDPMIGGRMEGARPIDGSAPSIRAFLNGEQIDRFCCYLW